MTDHRPGLDGPASPDDELASALLDGDATDADEARLGDASVQARLRRFEELRAELEASPPPEGVLDTARSAALAAFDDTAGEGGVRKLSAARARRTRSWQLPAGAVAAAVLLVVALATVLLSLDLGDGDDDVATTSGEVLTEAAGGGDGADDEAAPTVANRADDHGGSGGVSGPYLDELRASYPDLDALFGAFDAQFGRSPAESDRTEEAMDDSGTSAGDQMLAACDPAAATDVDPARVVAVVPAVVAEREVGVVVYDADDGRRVAVVDVASCDLEADRAL